MKKILINANQEEEIRVALVENMWLYDLHIENFNYDKKKSNIYKGKISHIETSLEAVFIDYGDEKHGFLPIKEISNEYLDESYYTNNNKLSIKNYLKEGQEMLIQISKEKRLNKGAVLTTFISLAGSYLILIPNNPKSLGISKRIDGENRKRLKDILKKLKFPNNMGIIIRTSGIGKSLEDLQSDLNLRLKHWELIKLLYKEKKSPSLIYKENNIIVKIFRDYLTPDISEIIIDNKNFIDESKKCLIELGREEFNNKIKFFSKNFPLFSYYKIESQIESAFKRSVRLSSGGLITIDSTEALTAIDINSSKSTKGVDIEETALNTNLEAASEIARQLRLRDLGGLIIIDFIDMTYKKNCIKVERKFIESTYQDRAKIKFSHISKFGLLEISRQRLTNSLNESNHYICPKCKGNGFIRNNKSLSLSILRLIEEDSLKEDTKEIHVIVPVDIGTYLLNEKRSDINYIENKNLKKIKIIIVPYNKMKAPNYIIIRVKIGEESSTISYLLPFIHDKDFKNSNKKNTFFNKKINKNIYLNKNNINYSIKVINYLYFLIKDYYIFIFNLFNKILYNFITLLSNIYKLVINKIFFIKWRNNNIKNNINYKYKKYNKNFNRFINKKKFFYKKKNIFNNKKNNLEE